MSPWQYRQSFTYILMVVSRRFYEFVHFSKILCCLKEGLMYWNFKYEFQLFIKQDYFPCLVGCYSLYHYVHESSIFYISRMSHIVCAWPQLVGWLCSSNGWLTFRGEFCRKYIRKTTWKNEKKCENNAKICVGIRHVHGYFLDFKCGHFKLVFRRWMELTECIITDFWDVTSCRLADNYHHFWETCCLLLQRMVRLLHPLSPFHKQNYCPLSLLYLNSPFIT